VVLIADQSKYRVVLKAKHYSNICCVFIGCDEFTYGVNCYSSCGFCKDKMTCDTYSGHCLNGCTEGWMTEFCNLSKCRVNPV